jgi:hypothetical protein
MQTRQVVALVTVIAIIALALGATIGYSISSGKTTTSSSFPSVNYSYICTEINSNMTVTSNHVLNDSYSGCQTVIPYWYLYYLSGANGSSNQNGTISIQIGSGACITESYALWNGSKVSVQIGQIGNTTCF